MHRAALVALVLLAPGLARAGDDPPPDAATIDSSIARGVAWLRAQQQADGTFSQGGELALGPDMLGPGAVKLGIDALAVLALVRAGASTHHDHALRRAVDGLALRAAPAVYTEALVIQALEAAKVTAPAAKRRAHDASVFLVGAQLPRGAWGYGGHVAGVPQLGAPGSYDNSNTQFALLGLRAGHKLGGDPKPEVWRRAGEHLLAEQARDGVEVEPFDVPAAEQSLTTRARPHPHTHAKEPAHTPATATRMKARGWGYAGTAEGGSSMSMTASGVTGLVLVKAHVEDTPWWTQHGAAVDAGIRDGMAWIHEHRNDPLPHGATYYTLYSIERASVVCGVEQLGGWAWYPLGSLRLVQDQQADGAWHGEMGGTTVGTCFALLFLTKATSTAGSAPLRPQRVATEDPARPTR